MRPEVASLDGDIRYRRTTVKDRKKGIGTGLLGKMLADLGTDRDDFWERERQMRPRRTGNMPDTYNYPAAVSA